MSRRLPDLPLPKRLEARLTSLPEKLTLCRDLDVAGADRILGSMTPERRARLDAHLAECERCRRVHGALDFAGGLAREARLPLPPALRPRLIHLGDAETSQRGPRILRPVFRPRRPLWLDLLGDGRMAAAASLIFGAVAMLAFGHQAGAGPARLAAEVQTVAEAGSSRWNEGLADLSATAGRLAGEAVRDPRRLERWWDRLGAVFQEAFPEAAPPPVSPDPSAEDADGAASAFQENDHRDSAASKEARGPEELP